MQLSGAAGIKINAVDSALGTLLHALVVASSEGHTSNYALVCEELLMTMGNIDGPHCDRTHADMVFFETPGDGAAFCAGSIATLEASAQTVTTTTSRGSRRMCSIDSRIPSLLRLLFTRI